jgi:hypothetical protein
MASPPPEVAEPGSRTVKNDENASLLKLGELGDHMLDADKVEHWLAPPI